MKEEPELPVVWTGLESGPESGAKSGSKIGQKIFILAHGAGAPMDSPFMNYFAQELGKRKVRVLRFEFPYMAARRITGKKRPPDRQPKLLASWRQMIDRGIDEGAAGTAPEIYIGGKSMGGRMASLLADEMFLQKKVKGLICLGYPFYAPGKQDKPRTEHLENLACRTLILQGERDAMGNRDTVTGYGLSSQITIQWAPDGNHDLSPRKRSEYTEQGNWDQAVQNIVTFMGATDDVM